MPGKPRSSRKRSAERAWPPGARLRTTADFDAVRHGGRKLVDRALVGWFAPAAAADDGWRLGLSVSRKVGDAPTRSRCKRVLREAFRATLPQLRGPPCSVVISARPGSAPRTLAQAVTALTRVLQRAGHLILPASEPRAASP